MSDQGTHLSVVDLTDKVTVFVLVHHGECDDILGVYSSLHRAKVEGNGMRKRLGITATEWKPYPLGGPVWELRGNWNILAISPFVVNERVQP